MGKFEDCVDLKKDWNIYIYQNINLFIKKIKLNSKQI